jgi:hypothetical protein
MLISARQGPNELGRNLAYNTDVCGIYSSSAIADARLFAQIKLLRLLESDEIKALQWIAVHVPTALAIPCLAASFATPYPAEDGHFPRNKRILCGTTELYLCQILLLSEVHMWQMCHSILTLALKLSSRGSIAAQPDSAEVP